jgi:uncharacterized protein YecE (DUF72 family)
MEMELFTGTSGYAYKEWKGLFYPEKLPQAKMLGYYASRLGAVEINNTFYRMPRASVLEGWAEAVPESFRFVLKVSRKITHFKRLKECGDELEYLLPVARTLGDRLGVLLFQLPPNLPIDLDRFDAFLPLLPADIGCAFEFRHQSWHTDEVYTRLRERNAALVLSDVDDADPPEIVPTADWGYLRLRRMDYPEAELRGWRERIGSQGWERAYIFFKHEDDGAGPAMAERFAGMD